MKNKKMLIIVSITILIIVVIVGIITAIFLPRYIEKKRIENAKVIVTLKDDLKVSFNRDVMVSDFIEEINGELINDEKIDTLSIGKKRIDFEYINEENIKIPYSFEIEVIDDREPIIWLNSSYTVTTGFTGDLVEKIMCVDDTDDNPNCYIEGDYDTKRAGSYDLKFIAIDKYGNKNVEDFVLNVKNPSATSGYTPSKISLSDAINNYKSDTTKIGIDVSFWQGDIDFDRVKEAGVEFAFIRVGTKKGTGKECFLDSKFKENIEGFNRVGIPVGIYFYSYASSSEEAKNDALWVVEQIKDYKIDLPVVYDWENWSNFNYYHLSLFNLTNNAKVFMDTIESKGYQAMHYSSKIFLEQIWLDTGYPTWLAHYTGKTNYEGDYTYWQFSSSGIVPGIAGDVDLDIMYIKE